MAEIDWEASPKRPSLRRAIRHQVPSLDRPCRIVTENFLAAESRIDLLGVGIEGELVSLRIGRDGEDLALLTRSLSDLAWLRPRTEDLLKLAPDLGIEPTARARAVLLCPEFQNETRAAIRALPPDSIDLIRYRCYRQRGHLGVLLEAVDPSGPPREQPRDLEDTRSPTGLVLESPSGSPRRAPTEPLRHVESRPASGFRTGLSDVDLSVD